MKKLDRGGAILSLLSLFVVFIYAQAKTDPTLAIATDSQPKIENNISNTAVDTKDEDKKLVKTTSSVKPTGMGASRGAFSASAYCFTGQPATDQSVPRRIIA